MNDVERLLAIEEVRAVKARYFRLVDTKQWAEFRTIFTKDATLYYPEGFPDPQGYDEAMAMIENTLRNAISVHHGHMPEIEIIDEHNARAIWSMEDQVYLPGDAEKGIPDRVIHGAGHYHETYRKEDGQWLIATLKLTRLRHESTAVMGVIRGNLA